MKGIGTIIRICILMIVLSGYANGQVISTEAPSQSYSADVVGKGVFQLESRFQAMESNSYRYLDLPSNLIRIGLTNRLEFRMTNGFSVSGIKNYSSRFNQIELGVKYALLNNPDRKSKLAIFTHITVPAPDFDYYRESTAICYSLKIKEKGTLTTNFVFGFAYANEGKYISQSYSGTLCYSRQMNTRLSWFGELYGSYNTTAFPGLNLYSDNFNFDTGIFYLIRDNIQLDYTFGIGLDNRMAFHSIGLDIMFIPSK